MLCVRELQKKGDTPEHNELEFTAFVDGVPQDVKTASLDLTNHVDLSGKKGGRAAFEQYRSLMEETIAMVKTDKLLRHARGVDDFLPQPWATFDAGGKRVTGIDQILGEVK